MSVTWAKLRFFRLIFWWMAYKVFSRGQAHRHALCTRSQRLVRTSDWTFARCRGVGCAVVHGLGQRGIAPRMQVAKGQILQFAIGLVQAQAVRNGA